MTRKGTTLNVDYTNHIARVETTFAEIRAELAALSARHDRMEQDVTEIRATTTETAALECEMGRVSPCDLTEGN